MKIGDLVKFRNSPARVWPDVWHTGIIVGFDEDNDPKVLEPRIGMVVAHWRDRVEVISASR